MPLFEREGRVFEARRDKVDAQKAGGASSVTGYPCAKEVSRFSLAPDEPVVRKGQNKDKATRG
jgi:hypothetical protein